MISITLIIIIINVVVSFMAFNNATLFQKSLMNPFMIFKKNEYWRFITSGFIHGSYVHLGFNMFTFYFFGQVVERVFGQVIGPGSILLFIFFYLSALIISDLPVAWKRRDQINYNSLGASGAVAAMVFASIIYFPMNEIYIFGIIGIKGFILGIIYIIYSYTQGKKMSDNINHEAHLYGAIYGVLFAIIIHPHAVKGFIEQISHYSLF